MLSLTSPDQSADIRKWNERQEKISHVTVYLRQDYVTRILCRILGNFIRLATHGRTHATRRSETAATLDVSIY